MRRTQRVPFFGGARGVALGLASLVGLALFAVLVNRHYPIENWLFFRYATYTFYSALFAVACLSTGLASLRLSRVELPLFERVVVAFSLGVFEFEFLMFLLGMAQAYNTITFYLVPALLVAAGATDLSRLFSRFSRAARGVLRKSEFYRTPQRRAFTFAVVAFGCAGLVMLWFLVLTPDNVQFDARWKHMALAEDFVAHGGLRRFPEGWIIAARPHMASFLYAWAFLLPGGLLFDHMVFCQHVELTIFIFTTLFGIGAVVRRLVPNADPRLVWAARFLFPGVFVYDSSPSGGTDHIGALFGPPIALLALRCWKDLEPRRAALLGTLLGAAVVVKETTAIMLLPFPLLMLGVRAVALGIARAKKRVAPELRWRFLTGPAAIAVAGLLATSPWWLKNLVWYGDPAYPLLDGIFSPRPFDAYARYKLHYQGEFGELWAPARNWGGLLKTLKTLVTFSFDPNNWHKFHGNVPVFGSLFTLLLPALLFLKGTRRTWWLVGWIHLAIFVWYSVHHQDRYLQGIAPLIAAATAAMLILVWRQGAQFARVGVSALVAFQIVWGGDTYFFQTHAMAHSAVKKTLDLLAAGHEHEYRKRFEVQETFQEVREKLPKHARLLLHDNHNHLGIGVERVHDDHLWQYGIDYAAQKNPAGVYRLLKSLGVTHIYWERRDAGKGETLAGDLLFYDFVFRRARDRQRIGKSYLAAMPSAAPEGPFNDRVAVLNCKGDLPQGLYRLGDLALPSFGPKARKYPRPLERDEEGGAGLLSEASFALVDDSCVSDRAASELRREFFRAAKRRRSPRRKGFEIWLRKD